MSTSNPMLHLQHSHFVSNQRLVMLLSFFSFPALYSEPLTLPINSHILCLIAFLQLKGASNIATLAHLSPR